MEIRPHRIIKRKKTRKIKVGNISVGGDSKISVQSMTNTLTTDVKGTINQILSLHPTHFVVCGTSSNLAFGIILLHITQTPKVPSSIIWRALDKYFINFSNLAIM